MAINYQDRIQQILAGMGDPRARAMLMAKLQQRQDPAAAAPQRLPPISTDPASIAMGAQQDAVPQEDRFYPGDDALQASLTLKPEQYNDLAGGDAPMPPPAVAGIPPAAGRADEQEPGDLLRDKIQMRLAQKGTPPPEPEPVSPWTKAETIGAAKVGDRYQPPTMNEMLSGAVSPWRGVTERFIGAARPPSVAPQDPFGIKAWEQGSGEPPGFFMGSVGPGDDALGGLFSPEAVAEIKALFPRMDNYAKKTSPISGKTILKRLETNAAIVSPEAKVALTQLADQIGERRVSADELHALALGQKYTPERVLRKVKPPVKGGEQRVGAPLGITSARQEAALRETYMEGMLAGVHGRDWYTDSGESIIFHANDDPARAMRFSEDLAITSPTTEVGGNTSMGAKGHNLAVTGQRVVAGRFPTRMGKAIEEVHHAGAEASGPKRSPFANNMARGGKYLEKNAPNRPVNDIWQGEMFGYVNEDGSPLRRGFSQAEHDWMDAQTDKIITEANRRKLGGFDDWDYLNTQAAAWTGAKIRAGQVKPQDAARSYATYIPSLYAQGSRETIPGKSTGHMPELHAPGAGDLRQLRHDMVMSDSGIYDAKGRDQIAASHGALVGPSFEGPGWFKGQAAPGRQTLVVTGSNTDKVTGKQTIDAGSRILMDAAEAQHGLLTGQDASAWSRVLPAGRDLSQPRGIALPTGKITPPQIAALRTYLGADADRVVITPTEKGVSLLLGINDAHLSDDLVKAAAKHLGGKPMPVASRITGTDLALPGGMLTKDQLNALAKHLGPDVSGKMIPIPTPTGIRLAGVEQPTVNAAKKFFSGKVQESGSFEGNYLGDVDWQKTHGVGPEFMDPIRLSGPEKFDIVGPTIAENMRKIDQRMLKETNGRVSLSPIIDEVLAHASHGGFKGLEQLAKKYAIPVAMLTMALAELQAASAASPTDGAPMRQ